MELIDGNVLDLASVAYANEQRRKHEERSDVPYVPLGERVELRPIEAGPYPHPEDWGHEQPWNLDMRELWTCGRSADLTEARRRVVKFDVSPAPQLQAFKTRLLAWMDAKGYPTIDDMAIDEAFDLATKRYTPPGAQVPRVVHSDIDSMMGSPPMVQGALSAQAVAQALSQADLDAQMQETRKRVQAVEESNRALLYSPKGLAGLFPTNHWRGAKITPKAQKRAEAAARLKENKR